MQQINLYLDEFKKIEPPYSVTVITILLIYTVIISVILSAVLYVFIIKENNIKQGLSQQTSYWKDQSNIAYQQHPEPKIDNLLLNTIDAYESQIERNKNVLDFLSDRRDVIKTKTFSVFLEALSKIQQKDLWLTSVEIKKGGDSLALNGRALMPSAVPAYIKKISDLDVFKSMQFEVFELVRVGNEVKFVVSSEIQEITIDDYLEKAAKTH